MKYAQPFNLRCYPKIKEYFKRRSSEFSTDKFDVFIVPDVSDDINETFRAEMEERGLPCHILWLLFKRQGITEEHYRHTHIDIIDNICKDPCEVSMVIPIEGYEGTHMYWCEGDYHIKQNELDQISYAVPIWADGANVVVSHRETIVSPTICRVNVPHEIVTNLDGSYRIMITARFWGNPSFEEVCEKLRE
jgi:hypothetical protein